MKITIATDRQVVADMRANPDWLDWYGSRPAHIQRAIDNFPVGTIVQLGEGEPLYVIGWTETSEPDQVMVMFSTVNPFTDYETAHEPEHRVYICETHLTPDLAKES